MQAALLDLNDCNLQLWHGGKHLQSPGYALLEGHDYRFGGDARGSARLRPRDINTRYWWQLSVEPLQPALGPARHTADLVHAHLLQLHKQAGEPAELLLAAPGSMQREQLALLLGIVQQCPFEVVGLVNRSAALGSLYPAGGRLFHLELQLHQALLSELAGNGGEISVQRSTPLPGCGLLQLQERLVEVVASAFIRQTRFDPRRQAATEQQLYDALPEALRQLQAGAETNLEVNGYRARINRSEMEAAGQRLGQASQQALGKWQAGDRILIDPIAGLLPGLETLFADAVLLPGQGIADALQQHSERLVKRGEALSFVATLPLLGEAPITPSAIPQREAAPAPTGPVPTHLLRGAVATPLADDDCFQRVGDGWQLAATPGEWLLSGQTVEIAGDEPALLIEVKS